MKETLEPEEAESLLAYLDRRGWKFRLSLASRDLRLTYKPRWFFRFLLFKAVWLVIALPLIPVELNSAIFLNLDWTVLQVAFIVCSAASVFTSFVYFEFEERARLCRVAACERRLTENAEVAREPGRLPRQWMTDE